MAASLEDQLTEEVTSLSTKLVEAVQKQSEMADTMHVLKRERGDLSARLAKLASADENYRKLLPKYNRALDEVRLAREARGVAEKENKQLKGEVEDLTASLFNEANEMVSNASREAYNFKVKNRKLIEELDEKDIIILSLQEQLKEVKSILYKMEDEKKRNSLTRANSLQRVGSVRSVVSIAPEVAQLDAEFAEDKGPLTSLLFVPSARAIRFDLNNYNQDFKGFVYSIIRPEFTYELSNLKNLRFFKKIWLDELESSISSVPQFQTSIIKNWTRTKNFWSTVCEGRAKIEPIKGINESFKLSYRGNTPTADLAPVAIKEPCSFCGEKRTDTLEHARLYYFKLLGDTDDSAIAEYPICNYCTFKLRNICEFFAKLRYIRSNLKLTPTTAFEEFAQSNTMFKRATNEQELQQQTSGNSTKILMNSYVKDVKLEPVEEAKLMKMYLMLLHVRNKIFWSKAGVWDIPEELSDTNIENIPLDEFERLAHNPQDWNDDIMSVRSNKSRTAPQDVFGTPRTRQASVVDSIVPETPTAPVVDVTEPPLMHGNPSDESLVLKTTVVRPLDDVTEEEVKRKVGKKKSISDLSGKEKKKKKKSVVSVSSDDEASSLAPRKSTSSVKSTDSEGKKKKKGSLKKKKSSKSLKGEPIESVVLEAPVPVVAAEIIDPIARDEVVTPEPREPKFVRAPTPGKAPIPEPTPTPESTLASDPLDPVEDFDDTPEIDNFEIVSPLPKSSPLPQKSAPTLVESEASELEQKLLKRREMSKIVQESSSPSPAAAKINKISLGKGKVSDLIKKAESSEPSSRRTRVRKHASEDASPAPEDDEESGLKRGKSKKFTKKMNDDLDETLEMLKDSIT